MLPSLYLVNYKGQTPLVSALKLAKKIRDHENNNFEVIHQLILQYVTQPLRIYRNPKNGKSHLDYATKININKDSRLLLEEISYWEKQLIQLVSVKELTNLVVPKESIKYFQKEEDRKSLQIKMNSLGIKYKISTRAGEKTPICWYCHRSIGYNEKFFSCCCCCRAVCLDHTHEKSDQCWSCYFKKNAQDEDIQMCFVCNTVKHLKETFQECGICQRVHCKNCAKPIKKIVAENDMLEISELLYFCCYCNYENNDQKSNE